MIASNKKSKQIKRSTVIDQKEKEKRMVIESYHEGNMNKDIYPELVAG
jgi:hypothetical protein